MTRVSIRRGCTAPGIALQETLPPGQTFPSLVGAVCAVAMRRVGGCGADVAGGGTVALSLSSDLRTLTALYSWGAEDANQPGEFQLELRILFADSTSLILPAARDGQPKRLRVSVLERLALADAAEVETAADDGSGVLGMWIGVSP